MSDVTNITSSEGDALETQSTPTLSTPTIVDYLVGCINMDIPLTAIVKILLDRDVDVDANASDVAKSTRDLCKADLFVYACMGVNRRGTMSDTDNGWTHSDGGYTITADDKALLLKAANAIYEENGEDTVGRTKFKVQSHGISHCFFTPDGQPLPHVISRTYVKESSSESTVSSSSDDNTSDS